MPNQASEEDGLQPIDRYMLALGRFVHQYAALETFLQILLVQEAGVTVNAAKAVFSGVRVDQAKSYIKRLREVNGKPPSDMLERVFPQITDITNARNDILHHGARFDEGSATGIVSNQLRAMPGRETEFPVSPEILEAMTADIFTITQGLGVVLGEAVMPPGAMDGVRITASAPWRYKHPRTN